MKNYPLNWKPDYSHRYAVHPPKTSLNPETAFPGYNKLKNFWAIEEYTNCPAGGWGDGKFIHRHLFRSDGFHHAVRWMPNIKKGWRRLNYEEFLAWYGIPVEKD